MIALHPDGDTARTKSTTPANAAHATAHAVGSSRSEYRWGKAAGGGDARTIVCCRCKCLLPEPATTAATAALAFAPPFFVFAVASAAAAGRTAPGGGTTGEFATRLAMAEAEAEAPRRARDMPARAPPKPARDIRITDSSVEKKGSTSPPSSALGLVARGRAVAIDR